MTRKGAAVARRSLSLARWARAAGFDLALGHGSVDLGVVSGALRIPSVQMQDYEYAGLQRQIAFRAARRVLAPDAIPVDAMRRAGRLRDGSCSDTRASRRTTTSATSSRTARSWRSSGIDDERVLVVVRPPPETSAYHAANPLYEAVLDRLAGDPGSLAVVIPRTDDQARSLQRRTEPRSRPRTSSYRTGRSTPRA